VTGLVERDRFGKWDNGRPLGLTAEEGLSEMTPGEEIHELTSTVGGLGTDRILDEQFQEMEMTSLFRL